jgi:hypothetical protein
MDDRERFYGKPKNNLKKPNCTGVEILSDSTFQPFAEGALRPNSDAIYPGYLIHRERMAGQA